MRLRLLALLAFWPAFATAQETPEVRAAQQHFRATEATARTVSADLDDLQPVSVHADARTGLTYVTLAQYHDGVEVFGTASTAAVRADGAVSAAAPRFQADLARRAGPSAPIVGAEAAIAEAEARAIRAAALTATEGIPVVTDDPAADRRQTTPVMQTAEPRLGYHAMDDESLRLAWDVVVSSVAGPTVLRSIRIDAQTGDVLADVDLVAHDTWGTSRVERAPLARRTVAPGAAPAFPLGAALGGSSYRVIPAPFESPSVSDFVLVTNPADPIASPLGWHDDGPTSYTTTQGNNAHAYTDEDANNLPDGGSSPDGGASLVFDFPFDPVASPQRNAPAAVTNLFYWNNVVHDVLYRYGFDEAAGNFQRTNLTGAGDNGDAVRAEALDGSGANNANFGTPPDGQNPRMQMFRWTGGTQFEITAPADLAGDYASAGAAFGPGRDFSGTIVRATGPGGVTTACSAAEISANVSGAVALIERGDCLFVEKVAAAQAAGAIGAVVYNRPNDPTNEDDNGGETLISMGGDDPSITIPSAFVRRSTGLAIVASGSPVSVEIEQLVDRDSGFDAGVVVHEYGHGISNRLIAGPDRVSCLTNGRTDRDNPENNIPGEQMGEGWSDFYGLALTQRQGDSGAQPRGVGTYLRFELPDGRGIRNAPYSTDFGINDFTYQDVIDNATHSPTSSRDLSIPHGVGFVWSTMLWEMSWELIDEFGFSDDIANADGTAGNQIALNLVTSGLKLTPCFPGFVDGRDAILAADQSLYDGAYADFIWAAFARRGLGVDADQGSSRQVRDGTASFTAPPPTGPVALGDDAGAVYELSLVGPNPTAAEARFTLAVNETQRVRVALYDGLGRLVREEIESVAAGGARPFTIRTGGLAGGVYVLRVEGESFAEAQTLTVVR